MSSFRNYTEAAKKFAPKKHRERVGATSDKPCPLHDLKRNRPCKQATNPRDVCPHFKPNRSRCAHAHRPRARPASTHRSPRAHARRYHARSHSQIHGGRAAVCAAPPRWHRPTAERAERAAVGGNDGGGAIDRRLQQQQQLGCVHLHGGTGEVSSRVAALDLVREDRRLREGGLHGGGTHIGAADGHGSNEGGQQAAGGRRARARRGRRARARPARAGPACARPARRGRQCMGGQKSGGW